MIFDTTFIIDLMLNDKKAFSKLEELTKLGEPNFITSLTVFELFSGLQNSIKKKENEDKIFNTIKNQLILPFDDKSAEIAGFIDGSLKNRGQVIQPIDSMIAGIALTKKEKVLTRNVKHFSRINGLMVETY